MVEMDDDVAVVHAAPAEADRRLHHRTVWLTAHRYRAGMSIHLTRDLETLHQHIMSMCAVVEEVVHRAVDELGRPDVDVSQEIVDRDDEIDRWDVRIEEECLKILALHQPVADNLRRVAAVMKIAWELERVADVAVNIAERAAGLAGAPEVHVPEKLNHMAQVALDMLRLSLDAFVAQDSRLARDVCGQDDIVDALNREIIDELLHDDEALSRPGRAGAAVVLGVAARRTRGRSCHEHRRRRRLPGRGRNHSSPGRILETIGLCPNRRS